MELDEAVDGLGAAVVRAAGVEVAEEFSAPLLEGPTEAGDLRDRARNVRGQHPFGDRAAGGVAVLVIAGADLLRAPSRDFNLEMVLAGGERRVE